MTTLPLRADDVRSAARNLHGIMVATPALSSPRADGSDGMAGRLQG